MTIHKEVPQVKLIDTPVVPPSQSISFEPRDHAATSFFQETDWFIEVVENSTSTQQYTQDALVTELRANILAGKYQNHCQVVVHQKDADGQWQQSTTTLFEFVKNHFMLRVLYQPVWSHALEGLKWGAIVGIGLKLLDTLIFLGTIDPTLAVFFLTAIGVVFIPRFGVVGVIAFLFISMKYTSVNFFLVGIVAALVGAILGCLPGMAIGGIIGYSKRTSISLAKDAPLEADGLVFKAVILPFIFGCAIVGFYLFVFSPWLIGILV